MNRPRDRVSALGLLPRMEARPHKDGVTVSYRYHPAGGKPIPLGTDKAAAIRKVLDLTGRADDAGTIGKLWEQYKASPAWRDLRERTQADYEAYSVPLLAVFKNVHAAEIHATDVARYLRVEREGKPRGNREISLLGNLIGLAMERGEAEFNPCKGGQVKRNKERPRTMLPAAEDIAALVKFAAGMGKQWRVVTMAAEFAALAGSRQCELLPLHWPQFDTAEVRLQRGKQRKGVVKVEGVTVSPALLDLRDRLREVAHDDRVGAVFPNRQGNPYTSSGFASMWQKLVRLAIEQKVIERRFTFHDLRAFYTSRYQDVNKRLPDLHASPTTTAKVYARNAKARRDAL